MPDVPSADRVMVAPRLALSPSGVGAGAVLPCTGIGDSTGAGPLAACAELAVSDADHRSKKLSKIAVFLVCVTRHLLGVQQHAQT
jgi:hypothetical protein